VFGQVLLSRLKPKGEVLIPKQLVARLEACEGALKGVYYVGAVWEYATEYFIGSNEGTEAFHTLGRRA